MKRAGEKTLQLKEMMEVVCFGRVGLSKPQRQTELVKMLMLT